MNLNNLIDLINFISFISIGFLNEYIVLTKSINVTVKSTALNLSLRKDLEPLLMKPDTIILQIISIQKNDVVNLSSAFMISIRLLLGSFDDT
jgi:hypothetical protein